MNKRLALFAMPLLLAGCASVAWVRPDTPPAQAQADQAQCQDLAWRDAQYAAWRQPWMPGWGSEGPWGPWRLDPFYEQSRLADFCMRARGYQLVEIPRDDGESASAGRSAPPRR